MPNRILRDYTDSPAFDGLSAEAERLFIRLIMKADDYGRFHANPKLVKAACFPLAEDLRANTVAAWLTELSDRQLVFCYTSGTGSYLQIPKFGEPRAKSSKYPPPPYNSERLQAPASTCDQVQADASGCSRIRLSPSASRLPPCECEPSASAEGVQGERASPPPAVAEEGQPEGKVIVTPRTPRKAQPITEEWLDELAGRYPHVAVRQQFFKARTWVEAHPGRALNRPFFVNWLNRIEPPPVVNGTATKPIHPDIDLESMSL